MSISQLYGGYGLNRNIVHNFLHAPSSANAGKGFELIAWGTVFCKIGMTMLLR